MRHFDDRDGNTSNTANVNLRDTAATSSSKINATPLATGVQATDGLDRGNAGRLYLAAAA